MREATALADDVPMALLLAGSVNRLELSEQNEPMTRDEQVEEAGVSYSVDTISIGGIIIEYPELLANAMMRHADPDQG